MGEPVDIEDLLVSYRRQLISKVQLLEFQGWGEITNTFRKAISEHQELENTYLAEERARRAGSAPNNA